MSEAAGHMLSVCGSHDSCSLDVMVATCAHANHKQQWGHHFQLMLCSPEGCKSAMLGSP